MFNKVFPSFAPLHSEFSPSSRVIDIFHSYFSFYLFSKQKDNSFRSCIQHLDNLTIESSNNSLHTLVIMDAGIKNNITTSISHTHIHNKLVTKTIHYVVNIISTETKLFTIRCGINQTTSHNDVFKIIIVTDSIHAAKKIFNPLLNPYQIHTSSILKELFKISSHIIRRIQSNFGSALAIAIGLFTKLLIRKWNLSISSLSFLAKHYGILARKVNVTIWQTRILAKVYWPL